MTNKLPELQVGQRCWFLTGTSLFEVEITETRRYLEGEPAEFVSYKIKIDGTGWFYEREAQHRSSLFLMPNERNWLVERIKADIWSLKYALEKVESEAVHV